MWQIKFNPKDLTLANIENYQKDIKKMIDDLPEGELGYFDGDNFEFILVF
jgi:hypothetical protein